MHVGKRYGLWQTLSWSRRLILLPFAWACFAALLYKGLGWTWLGIPTLPMSLVGVAVAFYLGFKNNSSYGRLWEARIIWGGIVNASRSWAYSARDLPSTIYGGRATPDELKEISKTLVYRHIAWMDALRHQLRQVKGWEHDQENYIQLRKLTKVPEYQEDLGEVLRQYLSSEEAEQALATLNPAAHIIAQQSRHLADLRARELLDGFVHMEMMKLLQELMAQQGRAERIKNFPFPRQYATVNFFFASLFALLVPFGLLPEFAKLGAHMTLLAVPFSALVSWVFLTTDLIGEWSENPFEGLANDVPISSMARGIERDLLQMIGETDLPPPRPQSGNLVF